MLCGTIFAKYKQVIAATKAQILEEYVMIIIKEQAEKKLITFLEKIKDKSTGLRSGIIRLSNLESSHVVNLSQSCDIIKEIINDDEATLYVFSTNDIVLLSKKINTNIFNEITLRIQTLLGIENISILCELYEVDHRWSSIAIFCEEKLNTTNPTIEKTEENNNKALKIIDQGLIDGIAKRRAEKDSISILIVEDEAFSRKLVSGSLQKEYSVDSAATAKEAINKYVINAPHIMFLDIELPDALGHDVLEKVTSFDPDAFVVMLSGKGDKANVMKAMKLGAKGFVGKPFSKAKLIEYIDQCPTAK